MKDSRGLVKFFDRGYILRYLLTVMLLSLLLPAEILAFMYLQRYMSLYVLLSFTAAASIVFLPLGYFHIIRYIKHIRGQVDQSIYPDDDMSRLAGALVGGIFLVIPGVVTKIIGFLLFFSLPKRWVGICILRMFSSAKKDVYEYLKLYSG
ncbi:MAG: FxsA family protein [Spirochaetales bacterium]|nr:FxsA family protein [Spirochaetales bacterium]